MLSVTTRPLWGLMCQKLEKHLRVSGILYLRRFASHSWSCGANPPRKLGPKATKGHVLPLPGFCRTTSASSALLTWHGQARKHGMFVHKSCIADKPGVKACKGCSLLNAMFLLVRCLLYERALLWIFKQVTDHIELWFPLLCMFGHQTGEEDLRWWEGTLVLLFQNNVVWRSSLAGGSKSWQSRSIFNSAHPCHL